MERKRLMRGRNLEPRRCVNLDPSLRWDDADLGAWWGISAHKHSPHNSKQSNFVIPDGCPAQAGRRSGTYPLFQLVSRVGPGATPGSLTRPGIRPG